LEKQLGGLDPKLREDLQKVMQDKAKERAAGGGGGGGGDVGAEGAEEAGVGSSPSGGGSQPGRGEGLSKEELARRREEIRAKVREGAEKAKPSDTAKEEL